MCKGTANYPRVTRRCKPQDRKSSGSILRIAQQIQIRRIIILLTALIWSACEQQPSPIAPSPTIPAPVPIPQSAPRPVSIFSISLSANGGIAYLNEPWSGTLAVNSTDVSQGPPATVSVNCGDGTPEHVMAGFIGAVVASCTFSATGTYTVTANATASSGLTANATAAITAVAHPVPIPAPQPPGPSISAAITCTPKTHGTPTPCNLTADLGSTPITGNLTKVVWDYGDGSQATLSGPLSSYTYDQPGTYQVVVWIYVENLIGMARLAIIIP